MPIINRLAEYQDDVVAWRHDLHRHPELLYEVHRTAATVAERLKEFGVDEIVTGLGRTGVVGVIKGRRGTGGKTIGLRADMDALPIQEITGKPYASTVPGKMHACGHDGHTAMLLGAARYLAETRNFDGTAVVIFQPAEEGGGGGLAMVEDGLMERFGIDEVYGMHNMPGLDLGHFAIRTGPIMAATDEFNFDIRGIGGHAAKPHLTIDTVVVGAQLVQAMQTIVSRSVDPLESVVVSVTKFHAGDAHNIIPETARLGGTVRTLTTEMRDLAEARIRAIAAGVAATFGATIEVDYDRNYPVTRNHVKETGFAARVASAIVGADRVDTEAAPMMGGEDFSYMLEKRPGAFIFVGNGASAGLHNPSYDFNDDVIPFGSSYLAKLVETALEPA
ncbi:M20 family metallopeptidase [Kaistia dalseonensis]|uniref:Hippurate hydrolase n=1 Tax=Kaistia dalseonensis TaxID=410840 RepID=A0ABU0H632_9HYPH|nr:M20 aminoacylase family protein [Kaistia dalseonensis]MCX5494650.1 M20 family metallopeptidase [Kaistia dalseonensis]MDQ0437230.1 hippurate hydrolase [Kaistia dalseonensis]